MNLTPEAKLLEMIKKATPAKSGGRHAGGNASGVLSRLFQRVQQTFRATLANFARQSWLQRINRVLLAASGMCLLYALAGWLMPSSPQAPLAGKTSTKGTSGSTPRVHRIESGDVARRNLFRPLIAPAPPIMRIVPALLPPPPPPIPLSQRLSHLRLVGLVNTTPAQAIIEDQKNQKTMTVSAGGMIGDVEVEKISNDQVIFKSGDDRFTLSM